MLEVLNAFRPAAAPALIALLALSAPAGAQVPPAQPPGPALSPAPVVTAMPMMTPMPVTTPVPTPGMSPSPSPSALATPANPPENTLVTDRVRDAFLAWRTERVVRSQYSPDAGGTYMPAYVAVVAPDLTAIGPLQTVTYQTASLLLGDVVYRYSVTGTNGAVSVLYSLDPNGKPDDIVFTPLIFRTAPTTTK
jgi:hypothetical protein